MGGKEEIKINHYKNNTVSYKSEKEVIAFREKRAKERVEHESRFYDENSVSIFEYQDFIRYFPYKKQAFHIERKNWNKIESRCLIRIFSIYGDRERMRLSRALLFDHSVSMKVFILKVLLWGYPTQGRGNNIEKLLEKENFEKLQSILEKYKNNDVSTTQLVNDISEIDGLGISAMSKFLYFLNTKIDGHKALILDDQIIRILKDKRIKELSDLSHLSRHNAVNKYSEYLNKINDLSKQLKCEPDQIEIFLFSFGKNVS